MTYTKNKHLLPDYTSSVLGVNKLCCQVTSLRLEKDPDDHDDEDFNELFTSTLNSQVPDDVLSPLCGNNNVQIIGAIARKTPMMTTMLLIMLLINNDDNGVYKKNKIKAPVYASSLLD